MVTWQNIRDFPNLFLNYEFVETLWYDLSGVSELLQLQPWHHQHIQCLVFHDNSSETAGAEITENFQPRVHMLVRNHFQERFP